MVGGIDSAVDVAAGGMHTAVLDVNGKVCALDQGSLLSPKIEFFIKCDMRGLSFFSGGHL